MLSVLVLLKQLPDGDLNPFDACALEEALRLPDADVTVLSMGRPQAKDLLLRLSRLGTARTILLTDPALAGSDTLCTAYALSEAVKKLRPDLVLCGRQSIDGDTAQVGPEVATLCGYSLLTHVLSLELTDGCVSCETRFGSERAALPALLTVERINTLRFPRLTAKTGEVEVWDCDALGLDKSRVGLKNSPTKVLKTFESTVGRRHCTFVEPSAFFDLLRSEAAKPRHADAEKEAASAAKLPEVWTVGDAPREAAAKIAERVRVLGETDVETIVKAIRAEKPAAVLWDSGLWGRRNAPRAAALLNTGLCADCTALETDGERLFMLRPAFGGSILAKIECRTRPQMATVRSSAKAQNDVMLGIGLGAAPVIEKIRAFAAGNGYLVGASRAVVDKGLAPYEEQVGLTGKNVAPAVYAAIGISGAVQHTCAIEQSGTVIAVNTDRSARIFDYADYGVVCDAAELFARS